VELIHDNEIIIIRCQLLVELLRIHRLDADEQIVQILRNIIPYEQLTEVQVSQDTLECVPALGKDFFSMGYK
jgi:hypothetical protein